ncbi:unnamed protein product [Phytophthora fragariaefolia]|uniref:Unnamed protein product n=1 Tax=Phytophthora fragariaefolia TaxID=1490495 RepID=A0A9W6XX18_9STRA|nr:unnamed protein product [Phytophthora fragariaefolia]
MHAANSAGAISLVDASLDVTNVFTVPWEPATNGVRVCLLPAQYPLTPKILFSLLDMTADAKQSTPRCIRTAWGNSDCRRGRYRYYPSRYSLGETQVAVHFSAPPTITSRSFWRGATEVQDSGSQLFQCSASVHQALEDPMTPELISCFCSKYLDRQYVTILS